MRRSRSTNKQQIFLRSIVLISLLLVSFERERAEISGKTLRWETMPVKYHISSECYKPIERQRCFDAVVKSFRTWESPDCTSLRFIRGEDINDTKGSFDPLNLEANKNIVVWLYNEWPYDSNGLALTTITYDDKTGKIYDADIELNGVNYRFDVVEETPSSYSDIQNTLTHEIGHLIGLDHSYDPSSVMYPTSRAGETKKRVLSPDDIEGVCEIYQIHNGCGCSNFSY